MSDLAIASKPEARATGLVQYDAMCHAIAVSRNVDEVAELRNKAMALEAYSRQARNTDAERQCCEIRLRAEAKTGELLAELPRATPADAGRASGVARTNAPNDADRSLAAVSPYADALARTGISTQMASRYQALAAVPKDAFEAALAGPAKPTTTGILKSVVGAAKMDDGALWLWGRLRDFERDRLSARSISEVIDCMTETMQADVRRIAPLLADWLKGDE